MRKRTRLNSFGSSRSTVVWCGKPTLTNMHTAGWSTFSFSSHCTTAPNKARRFCHLLRFLYLKHPVKKRSFFVSPSRFVDRCAIVQCLLVMLSSVQCTSKLLFSRWFVVIVFLFDQPKFVRVYVQCFSQRIYQTFCRFNFIQKSISF